MAALWEGTKESREEPGKQKTRSCRAQELAGSSAQGNEWQKKGRPTGLSKDRREEQDRVGNHGGKNLVKSQMPSQGSLKQIE